MTTLRNLPSVDRLLQTRTAAELIARYGRPLTLDALREELAAFGLIMTDPQWYDSQLKFIRDHRYFTASSRQLRDAQKQINIAAMATLLAQSQ